MLKSKDLPKNTIEYEAALSAAVYEAKKEAYHIGNTKGFDKGIIIGLIIGSLLMTFIYTVGLIQWYSIQHHSPVLEEFQEAPVTLLVEGD